MNNTDRDNALRSEGCMNKWSLLEITEFIQVLFLIKQNVSVPIDECN